MDTKKMTLEGHLSQILTSVSNLSFLKCVGNPDA